MLLIWSNVTGDSDNIVALKIYISSDPQKQKLNKKTSIIIISNTRKFCACVQINSSPNIIDLAPNSSPKHNMWYI